jgi:hypothetical protein
MYGFQGTTLFSLASFTHLEKLEITRSKSLVSVPLLGDQPFLQKIDLSDNTSLVDLSGLWLLAEELGGADSLETVDLEGCQSLSINDARELSRRFPRCRIRTPSGGMIGR